MNRSKYREYLNLFPEEIFDGAGGAQVIEDIPIDKKNHIEVMVLKKSAIFVFIRTSCKKTGDMMMAQLKVKEMFCINYPNVFIFFKSGLCEYVFTARYLSKEKITAGLLSELEDEFVYPSFSQVTLKNISDLADKKKSLSCRPKVIYKDGIMFERHTIVSRLGLLVREEYFPVADDDPVKFLYLTAIGGIVGLHKFITGELAFGIFYLLTCGGFGIFYLFDIVSILCGDYFLKQIRYEEDEEKIRRNVCRIYLRRLDRNSVFTGIACLVAASLISLFVYTKVYIPGLIRIGELLIRGFT